MATLDQIAQRRKELLAAEIAARREQAKQEALALLDKFDPSGGRATKSFMPPDPTWQGTGRQEVPGQDPTILDKRPDIWDKVPDMRTQEFDHTMMLPIPKAQPFNPADMVPMQRPSLDQADYSADVAGTSDWLRNVNFDLKRERRDRELGDYRRKQRLLREGAPLTSDAGTRTPTTEQIAALQDQDGLLTKRDQVADSASTLLDRRIPTDSAGTTVPTALIPRAEPTQQQPTPTRPYWDSIESIYGPNVRARVGDARADEMEMDRFGPAVTPGVVTRAPTTQRKTSSEAVDVLSQINRKKNILRAISSIWGTKDNSQSYETSALAKYGQQLTNRGLAQLTDADYESTRGFLQAATKAGIPLKQTLEIIKSGAVGAKDGKPKDDAKQQYKDANGDPHLGKISWVDGEIQYLTRDGKPIPKDWVLDTSPSQVIQIGEKADPAIKKTMIKRAATMMADARKYWLDEDGNLRPELDIWDALGWQGPARTTKLKMERSLSIALRLESGAAIGEDERAQFYSLFMPNARDWLTGDREAVIVDKFDDFQKYIEMIVEMIDPNWTDEDKREVFREVLERAKDERSRGQTDNQALIEAADKANLTVEEYLELERLKRAAGEN